VRGAHSPRGGDLPSRVSFKLKFKISLLNALADKTILLFCPEKPVIPSGRKKIFPKGKFSREGVPLVFSDKILNIRNFEISMVWNVF
jgi:hypothetical protein